MERDKIVTGHMVRHKDTKVSGDEPQKETRDEDKRNLVQEQMKGK